MRASRRRRKCASVKVRVQSFTRSLNIVGNDSPNRAARPILRISDKHNGRDGCRPSFHNADRSNANNALRRSLGKRGKRNAKHDCRPSSFFLLLLAYLLNSQFGRLHTLGKLASVVCCNIRISIPTHESECDQTLAHCRSKSREPTFDNEL